jgi:cell division transport system ATP-binding protein
VKNAAAFIRFDSVGVRYGAAPEVLSDVSFSIEPRSFHFLTGASGAGKSTLLRLMSLGQRPTRGLITLLGHDVAQIGRRERRLLRREIGMVFQDPRLLPHLTVFDNVALPLRIAGMKENAIREHVVELLAWVGLGRDLDRHPPSLSGGEQQRAAIARAVIARPQLLLADEPTGNVDDAMATRLMKLFIQLHRLGTTVVIATHSQHLIESFPYPRLHIAHGDVSEDGAFDDEETEDAFDDETDEALDV